MLLAALESVAERFGIPVSYAAVATEEVAGQGGLCVVRGERRIIIERTLSAREKARLLASGLAQLEDQDVFLLPAVRRVIEQARGVGRGSSDI